MYQNVVTPTAPTAVAKPSSLSSRADAVALVSEFDVNGLKVLVTRHALGKPNHMCQYSRKG
jgi:hypothetical protein